MGREVAGGSAAPGAGQRGWNRTVVTETRGTKQNREKIQSPGNTATTGPTPHVTKRTPHTSQLFAEGV